jgi:hypothetical protein
MHKQLTLVFATLALSTVAFAQTQSDLDYHIGYAANLNIGDSEINISNDGFRAGFYNNNTTGLGAGNICANVYVFDPSEEMVSCCSCLVTPNALISLSAKNDLINDVLTPAIPTSIVIKLVATVPGTVTGGAYTVCNPATTHLGGLVAASGELIPNEATTGMLTWGTTLEPAASPGTYGPVNVQFFSVIAGIPGVFAGPGVPFAAGSEQADLTEVCSFVQQEGTGFGVCNSCALGALSGTKQ